MNCGEDSAFVRRSSQRSGSFCSLAKSIAWMCQLAVEDQLSNELAYTSNVAESLDNEIQRLFIVTHPPEQEYHFGYEIAV